MQETTSQITAVQSIVDDVQRKLDALSALGSNCSMLFTWNGATHKIDGCAGSEFGARVELSPKLPSVALKIGEVKGNDLQNELEETAASLQDESERLRAVFSAISMFSRSDEPSAMRDIEKLADIGRCSSTVMEEISSGLSKMLPTAA